MCTARVTVGDRYAIDLFIVLEQCPRDLILGIDFLEQHAAQIDCSDGVVQLDLPFPANTATCAPSHLCSAEFVRLSPKVATAVVLRPSSPVSDGDYVVSPLADVVPQGIAMVNLSPLKEYNITSFLSSIAAHFCCRLLRPRRLWTTFLR